MTANRQSRRIVLHIGAQKTGSTSLHRFLARNAEALAQHLEVRVPSKGSLTRALGSCAMHFSLRPKQHADVLTTLLQQTRAELELCEKPCLISHENIAGAMMGRSSVRELYANLPRVIAMFEEHLAPFRPEYVLYTREMAEWKRSVHNQAVKSNGYTGTLETFLTQTENSRDWASVTADLEAIVGADRVRVFAVEDEADPNRPGGQLLRFAGLSDAQIDALQPLTDRSNQSLNPGALEFVRKLNRMALSPPDRKKVLRLVTTNPSLFAQSDVSAQSIKTPHEGQRELRSHG